jgi:hypothetical protein
VAKKKKAKSHASRKKVTSKVRKHISSKRGKSKHPIRRSDTRKVATPVRVGRRLPGKKSAGARPAQSGREPKRAGPVSRGKRGRGDYPPPPVLSRDERTRLKHALELVRKHVKGYSAKEGYSARQLGRLSKQRRATVLKKAATLKELLRQPHELVKAPTAKARKNLYQFTRQKLRKAKHFIVHKPADNFRVNLRDGRVVVRGHFEGKVRGKRRRKIVTESAFYLFPKAVKHPDDAERMLQDMLPDMPEGHYVMLTGAHGDTGEPADRDALLKKLRGYINQYQFATTHIYDARGNSLGMRDIDQKFAQAIVGFRLLSTTLDGTQVQMQARDIRRRRQQEWNERQRLEQMSKKERAEYEAPSKAEEKRQAKRKAAQKGAATRRAKAKKTASRGVVTRQRKKTGARHK